MDNSLFWSFYGENAFLEHCHCNLFTLRRFEQIFFVKDLYIKFGGGGGILTFVDL